MHVEIPRPRDATELHNDGISSLAMSITKQNRFCQFFSTEISSTTTLVSIYCTLSTIDLQCHVFPFEKLFCKCPSLSVNGIFYDVISDVISM